MKEFVDYYLKQKKNICVYVCVVCKHFPENIKCN